MNDKNFKEFLFSNFDKLLLVVVFFATMVLVLHITHDGRDMDLISWAREQSGTVLGALLGLITGHALASRATVSSTPGNGGTPPSAKVETETL